jgi:hypothetical protein
VAVRIASHLAVNVRTMRSRRRAACPRESILAAAVRMSPDRRRSHFVGDSLRPRHKGNAVRPFRLRFLSVELSAHGARGALKTNEATLSNVRAASQVIFLEFTPGLEAT